MPDHLTESRQDGDQNGASATGAAGPDAARGDRLTDASDGADADGFGAGEVRNPGDRRQRPTPWFSRYTLWGRRTRIRRAEDLEQGRYVDRAAGPYLTQILLLLSLVVLDAVSTLIILANGGGEANPIMRRVLERGVGWFLLVKLGPLPLAFILLSVTYHFGWIRWGMRALLTVYTFLAGYHFFLLLRIFS